MIYHFANIHFTMYDILFNLKQEFPNNITIIIYIHLTHTMEKYKENSNISVMRPVVRTYFAT